MTSTTIEADPIDTERVEVVLFDLGGVVFTFDFQRAIDRWAMDSGQPTAELRRRLAYGLDDEAFERGEVSEADYFAQLRDRLGVDLEVSQVIAGWNAIFGDLVEGITDAIDAVRRSPYRAAALSNTNATHAAAWSARYGDAIAGLGTILTSHELGHRKPERACYVAACEALAVEPDGVVFFDDLVDNVAGARAAGMQAVLVRTVGDVHTTLAALGMSVRSNDPMDSDGPVHLLN